MQSLEMFTQPAVLCDHRWTIARLPFKQAVGHALKTRTCTQSIIFWATDQAGRQGFGEGAPRSYVTHEFIDAIGAKLEALLVTYPIPALDSVESIEAYSAQLLQATDYPSIVCAIETALLDLYGQQQGLHLNELLPTVETHEPIYSMVIPFMPLAQARKYVAYARKLAVPHFKIKVGFEGDLDFVRQLLADLPADCQVRLDANRSWTYAQAIEKCQAFQQLGITHLEEPLRTEDTDRLPELSHVVGLSLGLDESLYTLEHARFYQSAMATGKYYYNLKLSKCGGYLNTHKIWAFAQAHGIPCQLGCNVGETAILSALGRAFAQQHDLLFLEGSFNNLLLETDLTDSKLSFGQGGKAPKLNQPGLGLSIAASNIPS